MGSRTTIDSTVIMIPKLSPNPGRGEGERRILALMSYSS
jgi:hypothetical protein